MTYAAGLVATLACGGCKDAVAPPDVAGAYALQSVGGQPMQVGAYVADTITFGADGAWTEKKVVHVGGVTDSVGTFRQSGTWTRGAGGSTLQQLIAGDGSSRNPSYTKTFQVGDGSRTLTAHLAAGDWVYLRLP